MKIVTEHNRKVLVKAIERGQHEAWWAGLFGNKQAANDRFLATVAMELLKGVKFK